MNMGYIQPFYLPDDPLVLPAKHSVLLIATTQAWKESTCEPHVVLKISTHA